MRQAANAEQRRSRRTAPSKDGKGRLEYVERPQAIGGGAGELPEADPRLYGTPKRPIDPTAT